MTIKTIEEYEDTMSLLEDFGILFFVNDELFPIHVIYEEYRLQLISKKKELNNSKYCFGILLNYDGGRYAKGDWITLEDVICISLFAPKERFQKVHSLDELEYILSEAEQESERPCH